jgi:hypothetical protein
LILFVVITIASSQVCHLLKVVTVCLPLAIGVGILCSLLNVEVSMSTLVVLPCKSAKLWVLAMHRLSFFPFSSLTRDRQGKRRLF